MRSDQLAEFGQIWCSSVTYKWDWFIRSSHAQCMLPIFPSLISGLYAHYFIYFRQVVKQAASRGMNSGWDDNVLALILKNCFYTLLDHPQALADFCILAMCLSSLFSHFVIRPAFWRMDGLLSCCNNWVPRDNSSFGYRCNVVGTAPKKTPKIYPFLSRHDGNFGDWYKTASYTGKN